PGVEVRRLYYDPSPSRPAGQTWREPDEDAAHARALALLNEGAALVTYIGHSHQFQWAVTNSASTSAPALVKMYDADLLANRGRLPVVRTLTCLSAAFQTPAFDGTTIDERMVVVAGRGAVAAWGPSGLGVAHGHDALARGFDRALWAAGGNAPLGMLVNAGYLELANTSPCCLDSIRTYVLLGDPLTRLHVEPMQRIFLPLVQN
ncbi:MAG TPA: C25 family cysteine peptidase, partial [Roseiflexaceae bacterium]|nr:C25 family cysteine peptidase [Roseiflexaceae bacterium]